MAASVIPGIRGSWVTNSSNGASTLSVTIPTCYHNDTIELVVAATSAVTISQNSGPTLTQVSGSPFGVAGIQLSRWYHKCAASTNSSGTSPDTGQSIVMANTSSAATWCIAMAVVKRGHATAATYLDASTTTTAAAGNNAITATGTTPVASNCALLTIVAYGGDNNGQTNTFPATTSGGATDSRLVQINTSSGTVKNRGIAVYAAASSPTAGVAAANRTVTLVTGANTAALCALSITVAPLLGAANDHLWGEVYKTSVDDATAQVGDIFYPTSGSGPFGACLWFHGGIIGGDRYFDLSKYLVPQEILANGYAVIPIEWRQPSEGVRSGKEGGYDQHTALRYFLANASTYNLDATKFVVGASSAGATSMLDLVGSLNDTNFYGPSPENSGTTESILRALAFFPGSNLAFDDAWKTSLAISNPSPKNTYPSDIGIALSTAGTWVNLDNIPRWNATAYPNGTANQDTTTTSEMNAYDPAFWGRYMTSRVPTYILHGDSDTTVPYKVSTHDGSSSKPPGLYQVHQTYGGPVFFYLNSGANHGLQLAPWQPSAGSAPTNGAVMDQAVDWLTGTYTFPGPRAKVSMSARGF